MVKQVPGIAADEIARQPDLPAARPAGRELAFAGGRQAVQDCLAGKGEGLIQALSIVDADFLRQGAEISRFGSDHVGYHAFQIAAGDEPPVTPRIGVLSSLPTQTAVTKPPV